MIYIFVDFDGSEFWMEVGSDGYALRQITVNEKNEMSISCIQPCLADHVVDVERDCQIITERDFERAWEDAVRPFRPVWNIEKGTYRIGQKISGLIKYFYPQGAIIGLNKILGCASIGKCQLETLYPNDKISGVVTGYDEKNMWILIEPWDDGGGAER